MIALELRLLLWGGVSGHWLVDGVLAACSGFTLAASFFDSASLIIRMSSVFNLSSCSTKPIWFQISKSVCRQPN